MNFVLYNIYEVKLKALRTGGAGAWKEQQKPQNLSLEINIPSRSDSLNSLYTLHINSKNYKNMDQSESSLSLYASPPPIHVSSEKHMYT